MNQITKKFKSTKSTKRIHPMNETISRLTSITTFFMCVPKLVRVIHLYLSNVWTSLSGFLTDSAQPMWLYFLSTPFGSSTSNSDVVSPSMPKTTPNYASMPSVRTPSSKKSSQKLKKSVTRYISPDLTVSVPMVPASVNWSTGPTTSSNPRPKKRGAAQVNSFQANGASSAAPKQPAVRAAILTPSSPSKTLKNQPSSPKKKLLKSSEKPKTSARGQTTSKNTPLKKP